MELHYEETKTGVFRGVELTYTVSLDLVPVNGRTDESIGTASVFSYIADDSASRNSDRPVLFIFNGGPGVSSAFLHFSGIGPQRVAFSDDLHAGNLPPYALVDSPSSVLGVADLVFIDPVGAGLGRIAPEVDDSEVYSVEGDARYFADIIGGWLSRHKRWQSARYLLGESYGTIRAAFVASALHSRRSIPINGMLFLGQAINVQEFWDRPGNLTGVLAALPTMATTAWYHGVGSAEHETPESAARAAIDFGSTEYSRALLDRNRLSEPELHHIATRLAAITGISAEYFIKESLCISMAEFAKGLIAGHVVASPDTRYTAREARSSLGESAFDAAYATLLPPYAAAVAELLYAELGVEYQTRYRLIDGIAQERWEWLISETELFTQIGQHGPTSVYPYAAQITKYFKQVPKARLFVGTGLYDSITTIGAVEHLLSQYSIPQDRVISRWYRGGHMMYSDSTVAGLLADDLCEFIAP